MIRIEAWLWPKGDASAKRSLGAAEIANVGGTETVGEYAVRLLTAGAKPRTYRLGKVIDFPRKRLGVWDLLLRALVNVLATQNGGRAEKVRVPASWSKPIADMTLETDEAEGMRERSDQLAEAIRAWLSVSAGEREGVIVELRRRRLEPACVAAAALLEAWSAP